MTFAFGVDTFGDITTDDSGKPRFDLKYSNGALSHDKMLRSIELIGTKVAPRVRASVERS